MRCLIICIKQRLRTLSAISSVEQPFYDSSNAKRVAITSG